MKKIINELMETLHLTLYSYGKKSGNIVNSNQPLALGMNLLDKEISISIFCQVKHVNLQENSSA